MKSKILCALSAIVLASGLSFAASSHAEPMHQHETHAGHGAPTSLQLNSGMKWETDEALRKAMGNIRQALAASLDRIHENRLPATGYGALARKVDSEVGNIVSNCKLGPMADAQLHLIVADLLAGSELMAGKTKPAKRQDGALKVIGALEKYSTYFNDPHFKAIIH